MRQRQLQGKMAKVGMVLFLYCLMGISGLFGKPCLANNLQVIAEETGDGGIALFFGGSTSLYYQVWVSSSLTGLWTEVRGMLLGADEIQSWQDANVVRDFDQCYYRLRALSLTEAEDFDHDSIDDVYELRHSFLNPLSPADGQEDYDGDTANNATEYWYGSDPDNYADTPDIHPGDADGDGIPDIYELLEGSDPNDFEDQPAATLFVDAQASAGGDGSIANPFNSIQDALDAGVDYDIIQVSDGIYQGSGNHELDFLGKMLVLHSENGPTGCVINCEGTSRGFYLHSGEDPRCVIKGLTIQNGNAVDGGAIFCENAGVTIQQCILTQNTATRGGALCSLASQVQLRRTTLVANAAMRGGAIYGGEISELTISRCRILENNSEESGGGIYCAE